MKTSILDQFAADAINAPETVTGGRRGRTRTRTRGSSSTSSTSSASVSTDRRTRRRHHTRNDG